MWAAIRLCSAIGAHDGRAGTLGDAPNEISLGNHLAGCFHLRRCNVAMQAFRQRSGDVHAVLRLGEIALAQCHALEAYQYFLKARELGAADPASVQRAAELAQSVRAQAEQEYAHEQAVAAEQAAVVFDPDTTPA